MCFLIISSFHSTCYLPLLFLYIYSSALFEDIVSIINDSSLDIAQKNNKLIARIKLLADIVRSYDEDLAIHLASFLINEDLFPDIKSELTRATCSFMQPQNDQNTWTTETNVRWDANCGKSFGHELMFSKVLEEECIDTGLFHSVKVARGGTSLYEYWSPACPEDDITCGMHWPFLRNTIRNTPAAGDSWKAFIWHQGSQESWTEEMWGDTSETYLGNFTALVDETRLEMFNAAPGAFVSAEDIPVIVVQVGYWPGSREGGRRAQNVRAAQSDFCEQDQMAELVVSNDLGRHYHYDAPSILVMGRRIAEAYKRLQPSACFPSCTNSKDCDAGFACTLGGGNSKFCEEVTGDDPGCQSSGGSCTLGGDCCSSKCRQGSCKGGGRLRA
jgi:hypothetical protein